MFAVKSRLPLGLVLPLVAVALGGSALLSLMVGARAIPAHQVWDALWSGGDPHGVDPIVHSIMWDRRLPRTLVAVFAGAALGLAGCIIQALTRNPLADTGVLGINSGAAFAIVCGIALGSGDSPLSLFVLALVGALIAGTGVYALGRARSTGVDPIRMVLAGVALGAILGGVGDGLALVNPQAFDRLHAWMVGSVDVGSWGPAWLAALGLLAGCALSAGAIRGLGALQLGDEMATSLGASLARTRVLAFAGVVVLAASATAAAGVFVFLGLLVPHLARWLVGPSVGRMAALSVVLGPLVLLLSDILGRVIVPGEFPAGVIVSFIGAPFLISYAQTKRSQL